jgi:hypothetical protein
MKASEAKRVVARRAWDDLTADEALGQGAWTRPDPEDEPGAAWGSFVGGGRPGILTRNALPCNPVPPSGRGTPSAPGVHGHRASEADRGTPGAEEPEPYLDLFPADLLLDEKAAIRWAGGRTPLLDSWADFVGAQFPGGATFCTFTYSEKEGDRRKCYSPRSTFADLHRFFDEVGYRGRFFFVVEPHRYRDILHLHGLVYGMDEVQRHRWFGYWKSSRGRCRLVPATPRAMPYCCKYALKRADKRGDWLDLSGLRRVR